MTERFHYLFQSTKGLALVAMAMVALVTALFGLLSGPMVEWGRHRFCARHHRNGIDPRRT